MLAKFTVSNFKCFNETIEFNFTKTKSFEFNTHCIKNNVVNKALVYGHNGVGKSNLGFAILDLISHLTDKNYNSTIYSNYINASSDKDIAEFYYLLKFPCGDVEYHYGKKDKETIIYEELKINGEIFASIDRRESNKAFINAPGADNLNRDIGESMISIVTYIKKNSVLEKNHITDCFLSFIEFVNGMLFFRSLEHNNYIGFEQGSRNINADIVEKNNVEDFESFLNNAGIQCKLTILNEGEKPSIAFVFPNRTIPFFEIASQGTRALSLFYFWMQRLKDSSKIKFLFVDEFDAFYHHSLSEEIIKQLCGIDTQVVVTTHNTSIMSNSLMRPDCYFLLRKDGIKSLSNCTEKELREAHNIEKMYRAGAFDE